MSGRQRMPGKMFGEILTRLPFAIVLSVCSPFIRSGFFVRESTDIVLEHKLKNSLFLTRPCLCLSPIRNGGTQVRDAPYCIPLSWQLRLPLWRINKRSGRLDHLRRTASPKQKQYRFDCKFLSPSISLHCPLPLKIAS